MQPLAKCGIEMGLARETFMPMVISGESAIPTLWALHEGLGFSTKSGLITLTPSKVRVRKRCRTAGPRRHRDVPLPGLRRLVLVRFERILWMGIKGIVKYFRAGSLLMVEISRPVSAPSRHHPELDGRTAYSAEAIRDRSNQAAALSS